MAHETLVVAKDLLNETLKDIMAIGNAEGGSLFLFDSGKKELILHSYYNSCELPVLNIRKQIGEGVAGKIIELGIPVLVSDIDLDSRFSRNGFNHYHTNSFISIPLFVAEQLIGLINITDKSTGEAFSEKDLEFAVTLCKYACKNLENISKSEVQKKTLEKYASVGKLAAGVVHEINNPLDGVIRYTNILLSHIQDNSAGKEYLMEIKKGLLRIANITRSLLDFSHQVNSNTPRLKRYIHLQELIDESLDMLKEKLNGDIELDKSYTNGIPRILDVGLQHVFSNLIKNAIDAMPNGGKLKIATEVKNSRVLVSFQDTGIGIPQEFHERIFEPFFTTKPKEKGTGLGLSICKDIVCKLGGEIAVQSEQGQGATFTVLIPEKYIEK